MTNCLRGGLGLALRRQAESIGLTAIGTVEASAYARLFEPTAPGAPSGFAKSPRPFVLRSTGVGELMVAPGGIWWFDLHLFDLRPPSLLSPLWEAVRAMAVEGVGLGRGRSELLDVQVLDENGEPLAPIRSWEQLPPPLSIGLAPLQVPMRRVRVRFVTPTELKAGGRADAPPEFAVLFARLRDRVSTLCAFYGDDPLAIDYREMGVRARAVRIVRADLSYSSASRRSTKTGQRHPLGGFTGEVEYEGDLAEFLPFLKAGRWTGVGRQTVWGKGAIETTVLDPAA